MTKRAQEAGMASEPKYYSVDGVSGPIQPAAASEQPTAGPQVREVIVGLQENIEQLCALLLQRTGEDRGKLAAPTASAGSAPQEWISCAESFPPTGCVVFISDGRDQGLGTWMGGSKIWHLLSGHSIKPTMWAMIQFPARPALQGEPGGEK